MSLALVKVNKSSRIVNEQHTIYIHNTSNPCDSTFIIPLSSSSQMRYAYVQNCFKLPSCQHLEKRLLQTEAIKPDSGRPLCIGLNPFVQIPIYRPHFSLYS